MKKNIKYKWIIVFFTTAIIIPGIILCLITFRGIKDDKVIEDRIKEDRLERTGQAFFNSLKDSIGQILKNISELNIVWSNDFIYLQNPFQSAKLNQNNNIITLIGLNNPGNAEPYLELKDSLYEEHSKSIIHNRLLEQIFDQTKAYFTSDSGLEIDNNITTMPVQVGKESVLVAYYTELKKKNIAVAIDLNNFLKNNSIVLNDLKSAENIVNWEIRDKNDQVLISDPEFSDRKETHNTSPIGLGLWTLHLQEVNPGNIWSKGPLLNILVLIIGTLLMLIGLFFTIRSLNKEYRLSKLKSNFISTVSHEFKSPITSIRQMSEMLKRERISSEARKREYYSSMLIQSERLTHLVDNILDFSRLEDGVKKISFVLTDLSELVEEIVEIFKLRLKEKGFKITLSSTSNLPKINCDRLGLQQVFYNLLDNSAKYSGKIKKIDVSLEAHNRFIVANIKDYGIGISITDQKNIFDKFYLGEQANKMGVKGSGIGLAIVNQIIKSHNGHIKIESETGKGSTFRIYLPIR